MRLAKFNGPFDIKERVGSLIRMEPGFRYKNPQTIYVTVNGEFFTREEWETFKQLGDETFAAWGREGVIR